MGLDDQEWRGRWPARLGSSAGGQEELADCGEDLGLSTKMISFHLEFIVEKLKEVDKERGKAASQTGLIPKDKTLSKVQGTCY